MPFLCIRCCFLCAFVCLYIITAHCFQRRTVGPKRDTSKSFSEETDASTTIIVNASARTKRFTKPRSTLIKFKYWCNSGGATCSKQGSLQWETNGGDESVFVYFYDGQKESSMHQILSRIRGEAVPRPQICLTSSSSFTHFQHSLALILAYLNLPIVLLNAVEMSTCSYTTILSVIAINDCRKERLISIHFCPRQNLQFCRGL